jgi:membrane-bound lytic murein transglycosylase
MNKKTKNAILLVLLILTTLAIAISFILYLQKNQGKNPVTTTTNKGIIEIQTTTKSKFTEEINSETETNEESITEEKIEETKQQITTTKSSTLSNNSSNKTEVNKTTPKPTTSAETKPVTQPTTESTTNDYYDKNKFPEGYIVTSNPHSTSMAGGYWVNGTAEYNWEQWPDGEERYDMEGNKLEANGCWHLSWTRTTAMASQTQKDRVRQILHNEVKPSREGQYDGEVYKITIWVWLPE